MYSWYVVRRTSMVNNNDTATDWFVLSDHADLLRVLDTLDVNPSWTDSCALQVYRDSRLDVSIDLLATVSDDDEGDDGDDFCPPDLTGVTIPALDGTPLPPGHPVILDGTPLHYGSSTFYN
ncbi:hypothetical protein [Dactylosporangium maewongense]